MESPYAKKLATVSESRQCDSQTISEMGISGDLLMETAGLQAAGIVAKIISDTPEPQVVVLCGKGNNAGDGLVMARYLSLLQIPVRVVMILGTANLSPSCRQNFKRLQQFALQSEYVFVSDNPTSFAFEGATHIIDALLGTGLDKPVEGNLATCIAQSNKIKAIRISLDIPSGLHGDSGEILGSAIRADHTISFGTRKLGLYFGDGPEYSGIIHFVPLSFPTHFSNRISRVALDLEKPISNEPYRGAAHKYQNGIVHVIAGSPGMTGAAVLAAKAAWYTGVGAVIVHCAKELLPVFDKHLLFSVKLGYNSHQEGRLSEKMMEEVLLNMTSRPGIVLIGPGLGRHEATVSAVKMLAEQGQDPVVFDADALYALGGIVPNMEAVVTPHPGELTFLGAPEFQNDFERLRTVERMAKERGYTIVSKGHPGIVALKNGKTLVTTYATKAFTRAGFGDVLAGKVAGFWARNSSLEDAITTALLDSAKRFSVLRTMDKNHIPDPFAYL